MMKRIELIEFLKGYSIFTIVIFHALQLLNFQHGLEKLIVFGGTGVHLFVFLSGFGLYYSHLHKSIKFSQFLKKRISKIYFPYLFVVLLSALISVFIPIYNNSLYALGGHLFLYKMFDETIIGSYGYPLWFISMIIQFYFMFYALVYLKEKLTDTKFLLICVFISLFWSASVLYLDKEGERIWNSFFLQYLWEFALGMVIAAKYKQHAFESNFKISTKYIFILGVINCLIYAFLALKCGSIGKLLNDIPALIGYSLIAISIYRIGNKYIHSFFLYTGSISYSIYLIHMLILLTGIYILKGIPLAIILFISIFLIYFVAYWFQKFTTYFYKKSGI